MCAPPRCSALPMAVHANQLDLRSRRWWHVRLGCLADAFPSHVNTLGCPALRAPNSSPPVDPGCECAQWDAGVHRAASGEAPGPSVREHRPNRLGAPTRPWSLCWCSPIQAGDSTGWARCVVHHPSTPWLPLYYAAATVDPCSGKLQSLSATLRHGRDRRRVGLGCPRRHLPSRPIELLIHVRPLAPTPGRATRIHVPGKMRPGMAVRGAGG